MNNLLIIPKDKNSATFLKRLLKDLDSVKEVKEIKPATQRKNEVSFAALSESSLFEEWLSPEDDVWDTWAAGKNKSQKRK